VLVGENSRAAQVERGFQGLLRVGLAVMIIKLPAIAAGVGLPLNAGNGDCIPAGYAQDLGNFAGCLPRPGRTSVWAFLVMGLIMPWPPFERMAL